MGLKTLAGWLLVIACALGGTAAAAAGESPGALAAAASTAGVADKGKEKNRLDTLQKFVVVVGGIVTLLGAAAGTLPKAAEAFTLRARRRKELEHIQSLAELIGKVRKENLLAADTEANLSLQVEAEINEALDGLQKIRHRRQKALEVRDKHEQPDLTVVQRVLLLYWPHSRLAWIPHLLALAFIVVPLLGMALERFEYGWTPNWVPAAEGVTGVGAGEQVDIGMTWGEIATTMIGIVIWQLVFRTWALWWRSRWRAKNPLPQA